VERDTSPSPSTVVEEVVAEARARQASPDFPHEAVARVRVATEWLSATEAESDDVRFAALLLQRQAGVDVEPPVGARSWPQRLAKRLVRKLVGWYVRFLGQQVSALGQAAARLGLAVVRRTEALEAQAAADRAATDSRLDDISARLARLEAEVEALGTPRADQR
jgi:hypothetical protein